MPEPAAKEQDKIVAIDTHIVQGTPTPLAFSGVLDGKLSSNVLVEHRWAAMVDSTATNAPIHSPPPDKPPSNQGVVVNGSGTVLINHRAAARNGDAAMTCNDPADLPAGHVVATSTVIVGG